ncbi:hypothetical protein TELCIR_15708 [Teladorsagia circumcincta]|uniref:Uncharacterized protein n=1 Tax=Teladorsagia circumcincta TaxID=45464 RepID=A0A2G9TXF0_TELCI|nr:hypothetical protein TELCIR_15708 [Teladorsagia circumcincta]
MSGANTQLYTLFSSTLLLTVILSLGPFLEPLPMVYNDAKKSDVALQFCGLNDTVLDIIKNDDILRASIPVLALRRSVNEALLYLAAQPNA